MVLVILVPPIGVYLPEMNGPLFLLQVILSIIQQHLVLL